ncbi:MAG: hypothetical protein M3546_14505 [Actinomycetota bacterium]|nr:hypothetical protein [Actinomycetota bacterium]
MRDLGALGRCREGDFSTAQDINDANVVVGYSKTRDCSLHAFKYDTRMRDLGTLSGYQNSEAWAINASGSIAGVARNPSTGQTRAWVYTTSMQDIGTLGGTNAGATDINNAGTIVGSSTTVAGQTHAFVRQGIMLDITPTATNATAYGVNNLGEVVGVIDGQAFLYRDGQLSFLTQLVPEASGVTMLRALDINDAGQIIGEGVVNGQHGVFLLSPSLLSRWAPQLRYHEDEAYRADHAAMVTDNYLSGQFSNYLRDLEGIRLAASDPSDPTLDLSLDFLKPVYSTGQIASNNDFLDANDNYSQDAQRLHLNPAYANNAYGRVVPLSSGDTILQYWLYYYNNPKTYLGFGAHVGDWELAQIRLSPSGNPIEMSYSQHGDAERCAWNRVRRTTSGRPIVYVAEGSHANFFSPGFHAATADYTSDNGEHVVPKVVDVTSPPIWLDRWPGKWGESDTSPRSPNWQGDNSWWARPDGWSAPSPCSEGQIFPLHRPGASTSPTESLSAALEQPASPKIRVSRVDRKLTIRYVLPEPKTPSLRVWQMISVVQSSDRRYTPLTLRTRVSSRMGTIRRPIGLGPGPWTLRLIAVAQNGVRSDPAHRLLR